MNLVRKYQNSIIIITIGFLVIGSFYLSKNIEVNNTIVKVSVSDYMEEIFWNDESNWLLNRDEMYLKEEKVNAVVAPTGELDYYITFWITVQNSNSIPEVSFNSLKLVSPEVEDFEEARGLISRFTHKGTFYLYYYTFPYRYIMNFDHIKITINGRTLIYPLEFKENS